MKRNILIILMLISVLLSVGCGKQNENEMEPVVDFLYAEDKELGKVILNGYLEDNLITHESSLIIDNDDRTIVINGFFDKSELIDGSIEITYKNSDKKILNTGYFKNGKLNGKGISEITIDNYQLTRDGAFIDNKLEGMGFKRIMSDGNLIQDARGIYEADKIK